MIVLVRHGQSHANAKGIAQGSKNDTGLTKQGHEEAEKTAEFLTKHVKISRIYSSPIQRAVETADHIAKAFKKPIIKDALLVETDKGDLSGLTRPEIMEAYSKVPQLDKLNRKFNKMDEADFAFHLDETLAFDEMQTPIFKIESYKAITRRIKTFLDKIPTTGVTVVVTHNGLIGAIMAYMFNMYTTPCNISEKTSNCHVSIIHKIGNRYILSLDRYNRHLD